MKNTLLAFSIFTVALILGGFVSDWAAGVILSPTGLFENTMGALATSVGLFVIVGLPLAYFARRKGFATSRKTVALWGLLSGTFSMAGLILVVDGLPLYFPQDILLIIFVGLGGATSALAWAAFSMPIEIAND